MLASGPAATLAHSRVVIVVQVVCGGCVLRAVQRGLPATATTAGLRPQLPLQEGDSYCDLCYVMRATGNHL